MKNLKIKSLSTSALISVLILISTFSNAVNADCLGGDRIAEHFNSPDAALMAFQTKNSAIQFIIKTTKIGEKPITIHSPHHGKKMICDLKTGKEGYLFATAKLYCKKINGIEDYVLKTTVKCVLEKPLVQLNEKQKCDPNEKLVDKNYCRNGAWVNRTDFINLTEY
ncbi:hypothetical protein [Shewanella baltica]|uniref:hypothetical protein n=1 Tax=Shewanella baltica TaxID=62322 RepID=UPI003D79664F